MINGLPGECWPIPLLADKSRTTIYWIPGLEVNVEGLSELKVRCPKCTQINTFTGSAMNDVIGYINQISNGEEVLGGGLYCSHCSDTSEWSDTFNASIDLLMEQFQE